MNSNTIVGCGAAGVLDNQYYIALDPLDLQDQLTEAILGANEAQVKELLEKGAQATGKDKMGNDYLGIMSHMGNIDIAKKLIKKGAQVKDSTYNGEPCLIVAFRQRNTQMMEFLLDNGADPNVTFEQIGNDISILAEAICLHHESNPNKHAIIELLLQKGADPKKEFEQNVTPITMAEKHTKDQDAKVVMELLKLYTENK